MQAVSFSASMSYAGDSSTDQMGTANAYLTNGDQANPNYSVTWQAEDFPAGVAKTEDKGTYSLSSDGSFSGSWNWVYDQNFYQERKFNFSFDPLIGEITGNGIPTEVTSGGTITYLSDGSYSGLTDTLGNVTGQFQFIPGSGGKWESLTTATNSTEYTFSDTYVAHLDGSFEEIFVDYTYAGDNFDLVSYPDGSWAYA